MMIFKVSYVQAEYLESKSKSLVIADNFNEALRKWQKKFKKVRNVRMTGIKVFWEFPIM